jgi:ABC-type antimicrobial peptide transport system permease subunit
MLVPFKLGTALRNVNLIRHPLLVEKSYQQDYLRVAVDSTEMDELVKNGFHKIANYPIKNLSVLQRDGLDSIQISRLNFQKLKGYKRLYKFEIDENLNNINEDNFEKYTVYFNNLDSVRTFQTYLLDQNLYLDVDVVEAKENFNKLNKTILLILGGLILFSMYCIILFTSNLISNHIQKNTKNLGTLKSFGMSNNSIIKVYFTISFLLVGIAFVVALFLSYVVSLTSMNTILRLIHITEADEGLLSLQFVSLQYCIVFISATFLIIYIRLFKALKGKTPGDLIYNR